VSEERALEEGLRRDRLRRQRFVSILVTALCGLGAWFYLTVFTNWPAPTELSDGRVLRVELTWWGWIRVAWMGGLITLCGLANLIRSIALTVRIRRSS
jgi:hypothetical protein